MRTRRLNKHHAIFLAPEEVGSSIRYNIGIQEHKYKGKFSRDFDAALTLTDCDKAITWSAYDHGANKGIPHFRKKIQAAIKCFERCLEDLDKIEERYKTYKQGKEK